MWIKIGDTGVQLKEENIVRLWIKEKKSRGRGKSKFEIISTETITDYNQTLLTFDNYTQASEALYRIVTALDERKARLELYDL